MEVSKQTELWSEKLRTNRPYPLLFSSTLQYYLGSEIKRRGQDSMEALNEKR
jgi:hypothetical protein